MTTILPSTAAYPRTAVTIPASPASHLEPRRRRRQVLAATAAGSGAALLARPATEQQLPFSARVSVRGRLLYPVVGAVVGTLLLGLPGALIGAGIGLLLA